MSAEAVLCTHKTASSASLVLEICPNFANPYLTQFSSISGGNCISQRSIYNSIHKPQRSPNETLGFNQDDHPYRMCNETGIPEFLELQIPGIPMVVIVTSRARSQRDPTQQDFINARTLPIYKCHTCFKF